MHAPSEHESSEHEPSEHENSEDSTSSCGADTDESQQRSKRTNKDRNSGLVPAKRRKPENQQTLLDFADRDLALAKVCNIEAIVQKKIMKQLCYLPFLPALRWMLCDS